jgi:hypothetical protein
MLRRNSFEANPSGKEKQQSMSRGKITGITVACLIAGIIVLCVRDVGHVSSDRLFIFNGTIYNASGLDVRFEEVLAGEQTTKGGGPQIIVSAKDLKERWLARDRNAASFGFSSSTRQVELKLTTINELDERETVSCMLDNRSEMCFFKAYYHKGALMCSDCSMGSGDL